MAIHPHQAVANCGGGDDDKKPNPMEHMSEFFGPSHVDSAIRQAVQSCWMALLKDRRNVDEVERQIRRLVDRALANLREDNEQFSPADKNANKGA